MILHKIEMLNFRQFKGLQSIVFSESQSQNITLILGNNTSGKTTLLQAFLWGLYGEAEFNTKDALLNKEVETESINSYKDTEVRVTIELTHKGVFYTISRRLIYAVKGTSLRVNKLPNLSMTYKLEDGTTQPVDLSSIDTYINEILPSELSTYFFYDTERFGNVTTKNDVADSVKGILGLTVLENLISHLGSEGRSSTVIGKLYASINLTGKNETDDAMSKLQKSEEEIERVKSNIKKIETELDHYQTKKREKEEKLRSLSDVIELQIEREKLEKSKDKLLRDIIKSKASYQNAFKNNQLLYLSNPLMKKALLLLKNANVSDKGIQDMNANSILEIIKRGKCICGEDIKEGSEKHSHLLEEMRFLPPESIGNLIKHFIDKTEVRIGASGRYIEDLENSFKNILRTEKDFNDIHQQISHIDERIKDKDSAKVYKAQLDEIELAIRNKNDTKDSYIKRLGQLEEAIDKAKKDINKNIGVDEHNKKILTYLEYARALKEWVKKRYDDREAEIRIKLENKVNKYFKEIYHGNRKVQIDDKYRVKLLTANNNQEIVTDESQGLETVKNFSFITGLVDLAKEKLEDDKNSEKESNEYPLVLDAPFSNADETHVQNISKVLPEVASQLVLIVMAKDWNYAEKSLGKKVGKRYILEKKSEIVTQIVEVGEQQSVQY